MSLVLIWLLWPSQRNLEWTKISFCSSQKQHPRRKRHPYWRRALFVGHHKNWKTTTNQLCSELDVPPDRYWFSFGFTLLFWHTYHRMLTMVDVMLYIFILLKNECKQSKYRIRISSWLRWNNVFHISWSDIFVINMDLLSYTVSQNINFAKI